MAQPAEGDVEELQGAQKVRFYRIRHTVMEMLQDRGYLVTDADLQMNFIQFCQTYQRPLYRSALNITKVKRDDHNKKILVFFVEKKLGRNNFQRYVEEMRAENATNGIFVVEEKPTAGLAQALSLYTAMHMEVFMEMELIINVSKHSLVPKHEVLKSNEKEALLKHYNVTLTQLPRILVSDPQARYLGLKPGDVVKITRASETADKYVTYRVVVPDD